MRSTHVLGGGIALQVRLDRLVLLVELGQIGHEILDNVCVWQWVDARLLGGVCGNATCPVVNTTVPILPRPTKSHTQASKSVDSVNVHRATSADTLSATPSEGQGGVDFVLDSDERIQHHRAGLVEVQLVGLHLGLLGGGVGIPAVDLELLDLGRGLLHTFPVLANATS
jgi:hypothetical protein